MAPAPGSENDAPIVVVTESNYEEEWSPDLDAEDLRELYEAEHNPSKIISSVPRDSNLLGYYSTLCLIFNRMIGKPLHLNTLAILKCGIELIILRSNRKWDIQLAFYRLL
jgi:hypothetical protein